MISFYHGNESGQIPGLLSAEDGYYWWESGAMFDALIQYWSLTGDSQYNDLTSQGILFQQGDGDFQPVNQSKSLGNDEQSIWAFAAMSAAETDFQKPTGNISWLSLAETVFNNQALRWDTEFCGGGLRWQIFPFNMGYNYKNSLTTGSFFQLASRLARFTGNATYSDWAEKAFAWTTDIGLIDESWNVFDGSDVSSNCSNINRIQYSGSAGTYITGAAHMYNITSGAAQSTWKSRLDGLLSNTLSVFGGEDGILAEVACENSGKCTTDMKAQKGLLVHWLVDTVQMAPYTTIIMPKLTINAKAAAASCNGGKSGTVCPLSWNNTKADSSAIGGVGEQLNALSVVQGLLVSDSSTPKTNATTTNGGSSGDATQSSPTVSGSASPSATGSSGASLGVEITRISVFAGVVAAVAWLVL